VESKHGRTVDGQPEDERSEETVAPGRQTVTARLAPTSEVIARAIVGLLRGQSAAGAAMPATGTAPQNATARGDRAGRGAAIDPFGVHLGAAETDEQLATSALAEPGQPLPERSQLEAAFGGHDLGGVTVHRGPGATRVLQRLGAEGLAGGEHIVLAPSASRHTLIHEAAHVIQQRAGLGGFGDAATERAADQIASLVLAGQSAAHLLPSPAQAPVGAGRGVVQLAELGHRPTGYDPKNPDFANAVPAANDMAMLGEMRKYAQQTADELDEQAKKAGPDDKQQKEDDRDAYLAAWFCTVAGAHAQLWDASGTRHATVMTLPTARRAGYFLSDKQGNLEPAGFRSGSFAWGSVAARFADWFAPDQLLQLLKALGKANNLVLIGVSDGAAANADDHTNRPFAGWASGQVEAVTKELKADSDGATGYRKEPPPKLVPWTRGDEMFVNVWLEDYGYGKQGNEKSVQLLEGMSNEQLLAEVKQAADQLRTKRDSVKGPGAATSTGFDGVDPKNVPKYDDKAFQDEAREINAPAYGAELVPYGLQQPAITVVGATNRFAMELDFSASGSDLLSQVTARMQLIHYYWELIELNKTQLDALAKNEVTEEQVAGDTAIGDQAATKHIDPFSGIGQDFKRKMHNIGTDTSAEVNDAMSGGLESWAAQSAWLGVVGLSATVRALGAVVSAIGDMLTVPLNEHSVGFDRAGTFLLRCVATPQPGSKVVRAPSVRVVPIRVVDIKQRAIQGNNGELDQINQTERELAAAQEAKDDKKVASLRQKLDGLKSAQKGNVETLAKLGVAENDAKLKVIANIEIARREGLAETAWDKDARWDKPDDGGVEKMGTKMQLLWGQLQSDDALAKVKEQTLGTKNSTKQMGDRAAKARTDYLKVDEGKTFRPRVTLASEENGSVLPISMTLAMVDSDKERKWVLVDLTNDDTARNPYPGTSTKEGLAGHTEAIAKAFKFFAGRHEYGRGTIAMRLPEEVSTLAGGNVVIPETLRCDPDKHGRVMQCLKDLATAAAIAGLFVGGGVGAAIALAGDLAGAITTVDNLVRHGLHWDLATVMDIVSLVGTAMNTVLKPALPALGRASQLTAVARKIENAIHIFGLAQAVGQVAVISLDLYEELKAIDEMKDLSPGERAVRQLRAIQGASMSGALAVMPFAQVHEGSKIGEKNNQPPIRGEHAAPHDSPAANTPRQQELQRVVNEGGLEGKKVRVVENASLPGDHTQVRANENEVVIEVGPKANAENVRDHLATARYYEQFNGPLGKIKLMIEMVTQLMTGDAMHGTRGHDASLEVQKLDQILQRLEGQRAEIQRFVNEVGGHDASTAKSEIDRKIEVIERTLKQEQALVDSHAASKGAIASPNTENVDAAIVSIQHSPEHLGKPLNNFEASLGTVRVNGQVDVPTDVIKTLLGGAHAAVDNAKTKHPSDLAALLDATQALSIAGDRAKLTPEQRKVLETLADTYKLRFADRGGLTRAGEDGAKIKHLQAAYPKIALHDNNTKVYHYSDNANGLGNEYNGTTFWQTEKPNDDYWGRFLTESTMGALREISVNNEIRLDEKATGQTHAHEGQALMVIHKPGQDRVPGEVKKSKVAGETRTGDPVFDPADPKYVEPEYGWLREGTREFVDPNDPASKHEVEEKLAEAYKIEKGKPRTALEAIHRRSKQDGKQLIELLKACREEPGLANRLLAKYGDATLGHVTPTGDGKLSIHGEVELSPGQLGALSDADLGKLVELARTKHGDEAAYAHFESTGLRFTSRVKKGSGAVKKAVLDGMGIPAEDARAKLFDTMSPGDETMLSDLQREPAYKDEAIRKQAAEAAFAKNPKNVAELATAMRAELQKARRDQLAARKADLESGKIKGEWTAAEEAELRGLKIEDRPHLYTWAWSPGGKDPEIRRVANYGQIDPNLPKLRVVGDKIVKVDEMPLHPAHFPEGPEIAVDKGEGTKLSDLATQRENRERFRDALADRLEKLRIKEGLTAEQVDEMAKNGELAAKHAELAQTLAALNQMKNEVNKATERYGEEGARSYIKQTYGIAPTEVFTGFGSGVLDQIWKIPAGTENLRTGEKLAHDVYIVIEAKGGGSGLGECIVKGERYQQGTKQYLQEVIRKMKQKLTEDPAKLFDESVGSDPKALDAKKAALTQTLKELEAAIAAGGDSFDYLKVQTPLFRGVLENTAADYPKIRKFLLD
jgi:hypothetical protein